MKFGQIKAAPSTVSMIDQAVAILQIGGCLIYPTETFYALGCAGLETRAVERIFSVKSRPLSKPLPLIIGDLGQLEPIASPITPLTRRLMDRFWPGPLSVLIPARSGLPRGLVSDRGLVCVRLTSHPGAHSLCLQTGIPLTASSANFSGKKPPSAPDEIDPELKGQADLFFNPPPPPGGGAPSTIVAEAEQGKLNILREGAIDRETLIGAGFAVY